MSAASPAHSKGKTAVRKCLKAIVPRGFAVEADAPQSTFLFVPEARTDNEQNRGMQRTLQHGARAVLPITSTQPPARRPP